MSENDFQKFASEQGEIFRDSCIKALGYAGFDVIDTEFAVPDVGLTLDIHVRNQRSIDFLIECKGSMRGARPGCMRTDTARKAIANAYLLNLSEVEPYFPPILLMTSHVASGGAALAMLQRIPTTTILDIVHPWNHSKRLAFWANASEIDIRRWIDNYPNLASILAESWQICSIPAQLGFIA